jgi:Ankyrin repeats (3 copies)
MPVRPLPPNPSLDHLKHQAKDLLRDHAARTPDTAQRLREFHPRFRHSTDHEIFDAKLTLSDAQLTIARQSGYPSWPRLKRHIEKPSLTDRLDLPHHERIEDAVFRHAVDLIDAGNAKALRAWLKQHPKLVHQHITFEGRNYFHNPTLIQFVAENPIRRGTMPANIVEVTEAILDANPTLSEREVTLALVATGSVPQQCRRQVPLIDLLCDHGVDPSTAMEPAALHGTFEALAALIRRGGRISLPVAATLGNLDEVRRLLPSADSRERQIALSQAANQGHLEIVRLLLDAGADPDRYNPIGGHSHGTPLHQAAGYGHFDVVRLIVERGAKLNQKDVLWCGTPADWAEHEGRTEVAAYLRAEEKKRESMTQKMTTAAPPP